MYIVTKMKVQVRTTNFTCIRTRNKTIEYFTPNVLALTINQSFNWNLGLSLLLRTLHFALHSNTGPQYFASTFYDTWGLFVSGSTISFLLLFLVSPSIPPKGYAFSNVALEAKKKRERENI